MAGIVDKGTPGPPDGQVIAAALSDPASRKVVAACIPKAKPVKDISAESGLPMATAYRHVNDLVEKGLLFVERGAMTPDGKRFDLYRSVLRSFRLEMDETGERVFWELNFAVEERLARMWESLRRLR